MKFKNGLTISGQCSSSPSDSCAQELKLYYCRFCSPLYSDYIEPLNKKFRVCKKFADKVYKQCEGSEIEYFGGTCKKIGDTWSNGKDLFENVFDHIYVANNSNCFNSSSSLTPSYALFFALTLCVLSILYS